MNSSYSLGLKSNLIIRYQIDKLIAAYILPPSIAINFINNIIVIILLWRISKNNQNLPITIFFNYMSMAINDIANSFPAHITHFLGICDFIFISFVKNPIRLI